MSCLNKEEEGVKMRGGDRRMVSEILGLHVRACRDGVFMCIGRGHTSLHSYQ